MNNHSAIYNLSHHIGSEDLSQQAISTLSLLKQELGHWDSLEKVLQEIHEGAGISFPISLKGIPTSQVEGILAWCQNSISTQHSEAAELICSLLAVSDSSASESFATALARLYEVKSDANKAIEAFQEVISCNPDSIEARYQLAFALNLVGRSDEGIEVLWPQVISQPSVKNLRLFGLMLQAIKAYDDSIAFFEQAFAMRPEDTYTRNFLAELYMHCERYDDAISLIGSRPCTERSAREALLEALLYRLIGQLDQSIRLTDTAIKDFPEDPNPVWFQIFNYSISDSSHSQKLLSLARQFWLSDTQKSPSAAHNHVMSGIKREGVIKLGFLSADFGDHVVSCFLLPILRSSDPNRFEITLLSTLRRYDNNSDLIQGLAHRAISLEGLSIDQGQKIIADLQLDCIVETGGFTSNSGIQYISSRCAPVQCHYIGYHATTGLSTIDYFIGDSITTPPELASQFTEQLVRLSSPWIAYDPQISFPNAAPKIDCGHPVFGCFSQASKIGAETLAYWAAAMHKCRDATLVIKGKGSCSQLFQERLSLWFSERSIDPSRLQFVSAVPTMQEHLDYYNKIDIALDTTPWSGATTTFEALGMGVPLVAICGDTTSARMSTSVLSAAGMGHLVAHSSDEFATIIAELAQDYRQIRKNKATMQNQIRSGILFDEQRICRDFFATIEKLTTEHRERNQVPSQN